MKNHIYSVIIAAVIFFATVLPHTIIAQERREPQFPEENSNVIFLEGEDAVSTNFTTEPTLYYGTSSSRTLQLNRATALESGSAFFAEYVFYIEEPGKFRFWYGGTPPGPRDDLSPSYTSPFTYTVDEGEPTPVYRENIHVRDVYVPAYYWNEVGTVELDAGIHRVRFEVREKRKYDGKYFFYLDNLFLVREEAVDDPGTPLPDVFPEDLTTEQDITFQTVATYEQAIAQEPEKMDRYTELALLYTLLGEHRNAIQLLQRAQLLDPENTYYPLLTAKNRIWNGDITQGLSIYKQLLERVPERIDLWSEAGKISAWTGNYQESIFFFTQGLEQHPENLSLTVNLGITHLWNAEEAQADRYFEEAYGIAEESPDTMEDLAEIFIVNGYPDKAADVYTRATALFPEHIGFYLELKNLYTRQGQTEKAEEIMATVTSTFVETPRLNQYIETYKLKQSLREQVIDSYEQRVTEDPNNLELRRMLVETYFWNGRRDKAIQEYLNILANYAYRHILDLETENADILELLDRGHLYYTFFNRFSSTLRDKTRELDGLVSNYSRALREFQRAEEKAVSADTGSDESDGSDGSESTEAAEQAYLEAGKALQSFLTTEQAALDVINSKLGSYGPDMGGIDGLQQQAEQDALTFEQVTEGTDWRWERDFFVRELQSIFREEPVLAGHVLGRIYQFETRFQTAEGMYTRVAEQENTQPPTLPALAETYLWSGKWEKFRTFVEENEELIAENLTYFPKIRDMFESFQIEPGGESFLSPSPETVEDDIALLEQRYQEVKEEVDTLLPQVKEDLDALHRIMIDAMKRKFYQIESDTYQIRYELGKYFLEQDNLLRATQQFEKVLDIDPWNIDAKFNLGVVRQRYGDWGQAKKMFREVYNDDPFYPNAATFYNQLARQHPDKFSFSTQLIGDPQMIGLKGEATLLIPVSTLFSVTGTYEFDAIRLHKTYGGEEDTSYQIHSVEVGFPIDLYFINLTVTPGAGLMFGSELFKDDILSERDETLPMGDFLGYWDVYPLFTGDLLFALDYFSARGTYRYATLKDTFAPERDPVNSHTGELSLFYSLAGLETPVFENTSIRGYGKLEFTDDDNGNIMGTALEEGVFGIHLFDTPWTNLSIMETVSFDHSLVPSIEEDSGYYAPDSVLVAKGGIIASSWFGLPEENSLGVSLTATGGGYWEGILRDEPENPAFQLELAGRMDLSKNHNNYYLSISGSQTWDTVTGDPEYWSLSINFGMNAKVMKLLAP